MIARSSSKLVTLDEFLAMPETEPYTELVDGVLEQKPVGKWRHGVAQSNLQHLLRTHPSTHGGRVIPELGFKFRRTTLGNLRVPDVSFYLESPLDSEVDDYPERAPDLAAEIRSKGQALRGQRDRLAFLREQGTRCTLLVDPEARTVGVHDGERSWTATETAEVTLEALNGFSFKVADLFA